MIDKVKDLIIKNIRQYGFIASARRQPILALYSKLLKNHFFIKLKTLSYVKIHDPNEYLSSCISSFENINKTISILELIQIDVDHYVGSRNEDPSYVDSRRIQMIRLLNSRNAMNKFDPTDNDLLILFPIDRAEIICFLLKEISSVFMRIPCPSSDSALSYIAGLNLEINLYNPRDQAIYSGIFKGYLSILIKLTRNPSPRYYTQRLVNDKIYQILDKMNHSAIKIPKRSDFFPILLKLCRYTEWLEKRVNTLIIHHLNNIKISDKQANKYSFGSALVKSRFVVGNKYHQSHTEFEISSRLRSLYDQLFKASSQYNMGQTSLATWFKYSNISEVLNLVYRNKNYNFETLNNHGRASFISASLRGGYSVPNSIIHEAKKLPLRHHFPTPDVSISSSTPYTSRSSTPSSSRSSTPSSSRSSTPPPPRRSEGWSFKCVESIIVSEINELQKIRFRQKTSKYQRDLNFRSSIAPILNKYSSSVLISVPGSHVNTWLSPLSSAMIRPFSRTH